MIKHIVCISNPFHLSAQMDQLVMTNKVTREVHKRPVEDLGMVIIDNAQITLTQHVFHLMSAHNVGLVICDERHHPSSMMLHLDVHHIQAERFREQIACSEPLRKNLWQQTIKAKIRNQAAVLEACGQKDKILLNLANKVASGDPQNIEGQAARIYFSRLFGSDFRRERDGLPPNPSLNYGYTIIRAAVARALVGAGLLPTLGIHHHNKYNSFALADDIMEPFRPFVDYLVAQQISDVPQYHNLTPSIKSSFLNLLFEPCKYEGERSPLQIAMNYVCADLTACFSGKRKKLIYPELLLPDLDAKKG